MGSGWGFKGSRHRKQLDGVDERWDSFPPGIVVSERRFNLKINGKTDFYNFLNIFYP